MNEYSVLDVLESFRRFDSGRAFKQEIDGGLFSLRGGKRKDNPTYRRKSLAVAKLYNEALRTDAGKFFFNESMSTSDFPLLFGDILDRQVLKGYQELPASWSQYSKRGSVPDFRDVKRFDITGGESTLDIVNELAEYPASHLNESSMTYRVHKRGRRMPFSFEAMKNDDLNTLKDIPDRFGRACRRSEEKFVAGLFCDSTGPHASVYTSGNKNIINIANGATSNNPPFSIDGLKDAWTVMGRMKDAEGEPIDMRYVKLVVGSSALEIEASKVLNATQIIMGADSASSRLMTENWTKGRLSVAYNVYIGEIITTGTVGATSWFLFADPNNGRPALEVGFMRGEENPSIWMKAPNATRIGGSGSDVWSGDFDHDAIDYKVRHIFGGRVIDPKMTVASNGTGS